MIFDIKWKKVQVLRDLLKTKEVWSKRKKCGRKDFEKTRSTEHLNYIYVTINIGYRKYIRIFLQFLKYKWINFMKNGQESK